MNKKSFLIFFTFLTCQCFAQVKINCCGIKETIPAFINNSKEFNDTILTEKLLLPSIHESKATIEIRMFESNRRGEVAYILKCINDTIKVIHYNILFSSSDVHLYGSSYVNLGEVSNHPGRYILLKYTQNLKPADNKSWNDFFKILIDDHLFDIPDQDSLNKKKYPDNSQPFVGKGLLLFNIKVGNNYRSVSYGSFNIPDNQTNTEIENLRKIMIMFYELKL